MASRFKLQIIDTVTNTVSEWSPGSPIEVDFVKACVHRIVGKGVGFLKTEAQVTKAIEEGLAEVIWELKAKVRPKR